MSYGSGKIRRVLVEGARPAVLNTGKREHADLFIGERFAFAAAAEHVQQPVDRAAFAVFHEPARVEQLVDRFIAEKVWRQFAAVRERAITELGVTNEH